MEVSNTTKALSGIIFITVPTIQIGGAFLLRMLATADPGYRGNPLRQDSFAPVTLTPACWCCCL